MMKSTLINKRGTKSRTFIHFIGEGSGNDQYGDSDWMIV